jgi:hypothetical protein
MALSGDVKSLKSHEIQARILARHCSQIMGCTWHIYNNLMIVREILAHSLYCRSPLPPKHAVKAKG